MPCDIAVTGSMADCMPLILKSKAKDLNKWHAQLVIYQRWLVSKLQRPFQINDGEGKATTAVVVVDKVVVTYFVIVNSIVNSCK